MALSPQPLRVLGIDPGARSGAWGLLWPKDHFALTDDIPTVDNMVNAAAWARVVKRLAPDVAIIEKVGALPKQGLASTFRFGMGCGLIRGAILGAGVRLVEVTPAEWKRFYRLDSDKEKARARAVSLFPSAAPSLSRKKDAGRAEALLIANWYLEFGLKRDGELV